MNGVRTLSDSRLTRGGIRHLAEVGSTTIRPADPNRRLKPGEGVRRGPGTPPSVHFQMAPSPLLKSSSISRISFRYGTHYKRPSELSRAPSSGQIFCRPNYVTLFEVSRSSVNCRPRALPRATQ